MDNLIDGKWLTRMIKKKKKNTSTTSQVVRSSSLNECVCRNNEVRRERDHPIRRWEDSDLAWRTEAWVGQFREY